MTAPDIAVERLGADYFADPYSVHARLRAQRPVTPVVMPGGLAPGWSPGTPRRAPRWPTRG